MQNRVDILLQTLYNRDMENVHTNSSMITVYEDRPAEFWVSMGPFFADATVRKDLSSLCDRPGSVWFVANDGAKVAAFSSVDVDEKGTGHLRNLFVTPEARGTGMANLLMKARLEYLRKIDVKVARTTRRTNSPMGFPESHGFTVVGKMGAWQVLEVKLDAHVMDEAAVAAGACAARKAIKLKEKEGKKFTKVKPIRKDFVGYADNWEPFVAGWVKEVGAHMRQVTTWEDAP